MTAAVFSRAPPLEGAVIAPAMTEGRAQAIADVCVAVMRLWFHLRAMRSQGLAFRRQSPLGNYIVDFECRKARLVVEVDGNQHDSTDAKTHDAQRTTWLESQGYPVLRFENYNVLCHTDVIVQQIIDIAKQRAS